MVRRVWKAGNSYGANIAWAAYCCYRLLVDDRSEYRGADALKGADFARRALEVAGDDPGVLTNAAQALAYFGEDIGAMMALRRSARHAHVAGTVPTDRHAGGPGVGCELPGDGNQ